MTARADAWSGRWCIDKLQEVDKINQIDLVSSNFLTVIHQDVGNINLATMSVSRIDENELNGLLNGSDVDFVLNVSREPYITQGALQLAEQGRFSIGGLGDAMRALRDGDTATYLNPEISFILQGLRQHSRVSSVVRLDNRRFETERHGLDSVKIIALDEYELTAEAVRNAIDSFPEFDAILKSNPNGGIADNSFSVASSAGIEIFRWGELLGALNRAW